MNIEKAVKKYNDDGDRSAEVRAALNDFSEGWAVWAAPGKTLDLTDAKEVLAHCRAARQNPPDYLTTAELFKTEAPKVEIEPTNGAVLFRGVSSDGARVSWKGVSMQRRAIVLLAMDEGMVTRTPDPEKRHEWVKLLDGACQLDGVWLRAQGKYDVLSASQKEALEARLYQQQRTDEDGDRVNEALFRETARLEADTRAASIQIGGDVHGSVIVSGSGNAVSTEPRGSGPVNLLVMYAAEDAAHAAEFNKHLHLVRREGVVTLVDYRVTPVGGNVRQAQRRMLESAEMVAFLVTSDALAEPDLLDSLGYVKPGTKIVPVMVRPALVQLSVIGGLATLPRNGRPITEQRDGGGAWSEVAQEIRAMALGIRKAGH